jgi:SAM-dependent methyltransferase
MVGKRSDVAWERFGRHDPYFGVISDEQFHGRNLDDRTRDQFFRSGEEHVRSVIETIHRHVDAAFSPRDALDFGCGVGRLLIPLARTCDRVVGVDVSESMLREARSNCDRNEVVNVELVKADDGLSQVRGRFDFIHSVIVFQHIPPSRGLAIFRELIGLLTDDGIGAVHFTYGRDASRLRRTIHWMRSRVPAVNGVVNLVQGRVWRYPFMQMNNYRMNRILRVMQESDCREMFVQLTDHGGHLGAILYFKKASGAADAEARLG